MKKYFTLLCALSIASHVFAQTAPLTMQHDTTQCSGEAGFMITCDNHVTNATGMSGNFKWTRYELSMPTGWTTTVCDKINCYSETTNVAPVNFSLNNNENGILKVNFLPNDVPGSALVKLNVSSLDGPYNVDAYYYATATGSTAAPTVSEVKDILLYPTPVREKMHVVFNPTMKPERLDVYNLLGQQVKSFPVQLERNSFKTEMYLADLDKGLYFVRVYQQGSNQVITKQFTKE